MVATLTALPVALPPMFTTALWAMTFVAILSVLFVFGRRMDRRASLAMVIGATVLLNAVLSAAGDTPMVCDICARLEPWSFYWIAWGCMWC
jgi:hypothetical protein